MKADILEHYVGGEAVTRIRDKITLSRQPCPFSVRLELQHQTHQNDHCPDAPRS